MKKVLFIALFTTYYLLPTFAIAQSVDILWQGETYTPPFFEGLPLWSKQSQITFAAVTSDIPDSKNKVYKWIRNGSILGLVSGIGRGFLSFSDTIFGKPITVEVEVLDNQENLLAESSITLVSTLPQVAVYENHPLYGLLLNREISGNFSLNKNEITLAAIPLYFSNFNLNYSWRSNNASAGFEKLVTFRTPENVSGSSNVSIEIGNRDLLKQTAQKNFLIQFGNE